MCGAAQRRWCDAAALDRPLGRAERYESVDREIYLPGRIYPVDFRGSSSDRAIRAARHRYGAPAPALRRDAEELARAVPGPSRGDLAHLRSALCADVGVLFGGFGNVVPWADND